MGNFFLEITLDKNKDTPWVTLLNSQARQSAADRAWQSINRFYQNCGAPTRHLMAHVAAPSSRAKISGKKGFPKFKKYSRSVEYKLTGYKLSDDRRKIKFSDGFKAGEFDLWCSQRTLVYYSEQQIRRVRVVRRADGYYCQFLIDVERQENHKPTGQVTGIDLGLKEFYTDAQGNTVDNARYLRKSEKRLKKAQRRLSKRFRKGKKQSNNYHKQRVKVAKLHLKVSRQREDKAIKDALALVQSNDLVVYEALKVRNLVKNRKLSKSISDASWYQFTEWLNYFAKIYRIVCVAVPPDFTSQDCSVCGTRVQKSLSTRTHQCPNCKTVLDRDHNAAINILKKGLKYLGEHLNGTVGHTETGASAVLGSPQVEQLAYPNALGESDLWILNGNIENLSRLVEQGISNSDVDILPRYNAV